MSSGGRSALVAVAGVTVLLAFVAALGARPGGDSGQAVKVTPSSASESSAAPGTPTAPPPATPTPRSKAPSTPTSSTPPRSSPTGPPPGKTTAGAVLAGRITPGTTYRGTATFYDAGDGNGACSFGPTRDALTAAMNSVDYETAKACGAYVRVRAAGGAEITVRITNECPPPCGKGQLDLSAEAFAKLAAPSQGQIPITWQLMSPRTVEPLSVRYKNGSSRYWCEIQAVGHRNPVARLEVRTGGGWRALPRTEYNYFTSENGSGCGGRIRLTDIYGQRLEIDGIGIRPGVAQVTRVQFTAR